jgi:putative sigma-54 modulation protein
MSVEFTGRNVRVTSVLKELARERTEKLERHLGGPAQVRVVLSQEKHRFGAEVIATHRRRRWKAQEETADPRAAMTQAFEKIDAQAKRDSEKRRDRKHRGAVSAASLKRVPAPGPAASPAPTRRIVPTAQRSGIKPMTVEEAAMRMESFPEEILVFRDAASQRISILYQRRDGDLGLIVPEC